MATRTQKNRKLARRRHHAAESRKMGRNQMMTELSALTVAELRSRAVKLGHRPSTKLRKDQLVRMILGIS